MILRLLRDQNQQLSLISALGVLSSTCFVCFIPHLDDWDLFLCYSQRLSADCRTLAPPQVIKMPEERYLPVHPSIPTPDPCSQPVKLTSLSALEAFLVDTSFASRSITDLTGGYINSVYQIHLQKPFEGSQTVVLKHAQPFWRSSVTDSCGVERPVRARELTKVIAQLTHYSRYSKWKR